MGVRVPLSIFNSKAFVGKVLFSCVLITGLYLILIQRLSVPITTGQNQYQENRMKAENYIFNDHWCQAVILGSSLSDGLKEEYFDGSVCNLAFGGGSGLWGGPIVMASAQRPQWVLIETNVLVATNQDFMQSLFGPPDYTLKKVSPLLRQASQPVTQILNWLRTKFPPKPKSLTSEQVESWVKYYVETYQHLSEADKKTFQNNFENLKVLFNQMQTAGLKIILYQMPIDPRLAETEKMRWEQAFWQKYAEDNQLPLIKFSLTPEMKTKDGLHLEDPALQSVASALRAALEIKIKQ